MEKADTVVAVFADHRSAEVAVKKLAEIGFDKQHLSVLGKSFQSDAKVGGSALAIGLKFGASWAPFGAASWAGLAGCS